MEIIKGSYETLFIVDPNLDADATKAVVEKFTSLITSEGGTIDSISEWGKRRLAYPIKDLNEGYYVLVNFTAGPELPLELDRVFGITEPIMRNIIIRHDTKKAGPEPVPAAEATPEKSEDD